MKHFFPSLWPAVVAVALGCAPSPRTSFPPSPAVAGTGAATATSAAADVDARRKAFAELLQEHWEHQLRTNPELASTLGDRRYNDRWTDPSLAAVQADLAEKMKFLERFEKIDPADFSEQEQLSHRLIVRELREELENARFEPWLMPVTQFGGMHLYAAQLQSELSFATVKDYEDYAGRLRKLPTLLHQLTELMRAGRDKRLVPPKHVLPKVQTQAETLARHAPEASPFAEPLKRFPEAFSKEDRARLEAAILGAIRQLVAPAYRRFAEFVRDEYVPHGRAEAGIWALPDGQARYAAAIRRLTTTKMTADEIHELGLREVARIEAEQEAIGKKLGFKNLAAFRKHIKRDKKHRAKSREHILELYRKHTAAMYVEIPKLFGRLPKQEMVILPVEKFREKTASGASYIQGAKDGSRPAMVRVNTYEATKRSTTDMESTAYHEGVPGHHLQIAIQQELEELPPFRQQAYYGAFQEGWALYAERLGKEVGMFKDPYSDYGRLQDEMMRAIRLVVDTGLHHKRWTRDQVVAFFHAHSTIDEPTVQSETDRYMVWPAQALTYKIGQLTIIRLREKAKAALGERFDVRAFHDEVLGAGALPLDVLEERIDAWIVRQQPAAAGAG